MRTRPDRPRRGARVIRGRTRAARGASYEAWVNEHAVRAVDLVQLLAPDSDIAAKASRVLTTAYADVAPAEDALVRAAVEVCGPLDAEAAGRLALLLTEVDGRSAPAVAGLLGRNEGEVKALSHAAREAAALPATHTRRCHGWPLVDARDRVTVAEQDAANGHLGWCQWCRHRLREREAVRRRLIAGATAGSGIVAETIGLAASTSGGALGAGALGGIVAGKAGAALIGATALAIAAASAGVAAAHHGRAAPPRPASVQSPGADTTVPAVGSGSPGPASSGAVAGTSSAQDPNGASGATHAPGATSTSVATTAAPGSLPTSLPSTLTTLLPQPLQSPLQSPLPSLAPLPVGSTLPSVPPLPLGTSSPSLPSLTPLPVVSTITSSLPSAPSLLH